MIIEIILFMQRADVVKLSQSSAQDLEAIVESGLQVNSVGNRIFEWLMWPESVLIPYRLRLPLGTSLLAMATRSSNA